MLFLKRTVKSMLFYYYTNDKLFISYRTLFTRHSGTIIFKFSAIWSKYCFR